MVWNQTLKLALICVICGFIDKIRPNGFTRLAEGKDVNESSHYQFILITFVEK